MDSSGNALSLKNEARLTLIKPTIDLAAETLTVTLLDEQTMPVRWSSSSSDPPVAALAPLVISLVAGTSRGEGEPVTVVQVCGDTCTVHTYQGATVSEWFSTALRRQCNLARRPPGHEYERNQFSVVGAAATAAEAVPRLSGEAGPNDGDRSNGGGEDDCAVQGAVGAPLAFSNEGQLLLVSEETVDDLQSRLAPVSQSDGLIDESDSSSSGSEEELAGQEGIEDGEGRLRSPRRPANFTPARICDLAARLRPNIVVRGVTDGAFGSSNLQPYAEDQWCSVRASVVGAVPSQEGKQGGVSTATVPLRLELRGFKLCNRCGVVNVDTVSTCRVKNRLAR